MTVEERPLGESIDDPVDDAFVQRVWHHVETSQAPIAGRWIGAAVLVAAAIAAIVLTTGLPNNASTSFEIPTVVPQTITLSDGTSITHTGDLRVVLLGPRRVLLELREGDATFDIAPGGPRAWTVDFGFGRVDVLGTRFLISRAPTRGRVTLIRGSVLVTSPFLSDNNRVLEPGDSVVLEDSPKPSPVPTAAVPPPKTQPQRPASPAPRPSEVPPAAPERVPVERPEEHEETTDEPVGESAAARSLTAYSRGKSLLEAGKPVEAAQAFETSLRAGLPSTLHEPALRYVVAAHAAAGAVAASRRAAADYLLRFPSGAAADEMRAVRDGETPP